MNSTALTIFGICFIFLMTCLGASIIFFFKKDLSSKSHALLVSFSNGIMLASSIWSLLIPSISTSQDAYGSLAVLPVVVGFLLGAFFMFFIGVSSKSSFSNQNLHKRNLSARKKKFLAIFLHNIPEGLSVGLAFGTALATGNESLVMIAVSLAIGIGLQNIPEGMAVALPMYEETRSRPKAFLYGFVSGAIEPLSAGLGLLLSSFFASLLPWFLAFAGGTMIYSLIEDFSSSSSDKDSGSKIVWAFVVGFLLMMILDVIFA